MTTSQQLQAPLGVLLLSRAVEPSGRPISTSGGSSTSDSPSNESLNSNKRNRLVDTQYQDGAHSLPSGDDYLDLVFPGASTGYQWLVERAAVGSVLTGWSKCEVHIGEPDAANQFSTIVEESDVPNSDIADEASPICVPSGHVLTFRFIGPGGSMTNVDATAAIQYRIEQS